MLSRDRVDLAEIVRGSMALLRSGGRLDEHTLDVDLQSAWVDADPPRLRQVVDNLLLNALRYTPAGGRIKVCTLRDGDEAVLCVEDNGVGIRNCCRAFSGLFVQVRGPWIARKVD
jgi:signal transduction histidine kinase